MQLVGIVKIVTIRLCKIVMKLSIEWVSYCIQDTLDHPCCRHYTLFGRGKKTVVLAQFHEIKQDEYEKLCGAIIEK